jgi:hypothetical protein
MDESTPEHGKNIGEEANNIVTFENGNSYRVLPWAEAYMANMRASSKEPNKASLEKASSLPQPSIENHGAILEDTHGKAFRALGRGNPNKVVASGIVADMVRAPHGEVRFEHRPDGKSVVVEEYFLGSRDFTPEDARTMPQEEVDTIISHMLIAEDLDAKAGNFIVTIDGKVKRIDSKKVFQESQDTMGDDVSTDELRQKLVRERIQYDPALHTLIKRADPKTVEGLVKSFDKNDFKIRMQEGKISKQYQQSILERVETTIATAISHLQEYKSIELSTHSSNKLDSIPSAAVE